MDDDSSTDPEGSRDQRGGSPTAGDLRLSDDEGFVGDTVTLRGTNLPPDRTVAVRWKSVEGMWGIRRSNRVLGPQYSPREERIFTTSTEDTRSFREDWVVPEDFGGTHTLELWADDEKLDTATFTITPYFELDRTEAAVGEWFRLTGYGLGRDRITTCYQITWDNGYMGLVTGVKNRGTATAEIRAASPPGDHVIQVWRNYTGVPFLQNYTQAPSDGLSGGRQSTWHVEVTEPDRAPPTAEMEAMYDERPVDGHIPAVEEESDAELEISPTSGKPGTDAIITGREFTPETEVDLVWHTQGGERATGDPVHPRPRPGLFPTVVTDEEGSFQTDVTVPSDVGATRPITAEVDGSSVAATGFMLQPYVEDVSPTEGAAGTTITVEVGGLGWPLYENTYYVLYDNKPMGYVVSNLADEDGIVRFEVQASGEPGYHFIDMVPSFNDTEVEEFDFDHKPHLSYLDNHPARAMPGLYLAFEVTE